MPADRLAVHHGGALPVGALRSFALDDAGDPDADAEQPVRVGARVAQHVGDARTDVGDDAVDVVTVLGEQPFGAGQFGEREVEELDAHPGLPDVDAHQQPAVRSDPEQRAGAAAVGVDDARLLEEPLGGEFRHDVADGTRTQPGGGSELLTAQRAVEIQPLQYPRPIAPPQVTHGPSVALGHVAPSRPGTYLVPDLDATFSHLLNHGIN
ncbi:hypothetical protein Smic_73870 [Streptomyces microflavus]|uniref:Uncharacterized protein n=1 Tax=Streptomyces microflavus TaxID=1919 RepID=A0A7J0D255_STRMI|nr:hypothetical protein Smic_73870 [Streptomyces microflavus]